MKLRTRIFAVSFASSVILLGAASAAGFVMSRAESSASTAEAASALAELELMAASGPMDAGRTMEALAPLRRDLARRTILAQDRAVAGIGALALIVAAGALAAFAVSASAAAMLTRRWDRLRRGLDALAAGETGLRFGGGTDDEFGPLEAELDRLLDALDDRERVKLELKALQGWGEASAFLAHQARTPLASLALSARTAREALSGSSLSANATTAAGTVDAASAALAREAAARIEADATRLSTLFSRVRSLSGFKDPEPEELDPAAVLSEAVATAGARDPRVTAAAVTVSREGGPATARLDRAYLREAFVNLLSNSAEACARCASPFSASLAMRFKPGRLELDYSDAVSGLPPGEASRVGRPRYTTKPDGTGLGVWLVGRIAALHGGSLSVSDTPAGGLRFLMTFPRDGGS